MTRKQRKKRTVRKFMLTIAFFILLIFGTRFYAVTLQDPFRVWPLPVNDLIQEVVVNIDSSPDSVDYTLLSEHLYSSNAILLRVKDSTVLMEKNSEERIFPASLTKIMTAIVALELISDLSEKIQLTDPMIQALKDSNASIAGFVSGEKVHAKDLLYGVLLPSGAECCIALAAYTKGSEENFVALMNQKATELKMTNTHFVNTTGLHDDNHYSTVEDISKLLIYALQNDTFREIFTTARHFIQPTNKHADGITIYSTLFKKLNDSNLKNGEILGGKTGYTEKAGLCLASLAKIRSQEYILVTAGAQGDSYTEQFNISDAITVFNGL